MKKKHQKTLQLIFSHPISGNINWADVKALLISFGAEVEEREGSRVAITLNEDTVIQHRPHPSPNIDKGVVASL